MDSNPNTIKKMHEEQGRAKIEKLRNKIDITKYNMEISEGNIAETPSDTQQEKLAQKNKQRKHGIASLEKEIHDIEQVLEG